VVVVVAFLVFLAELEYRCPVNLTRTRVKTTQVLEPMVVVLEQAVAASGEGAAALVVEAAHVVA
jgi:hypothetical protein